MYIRIIYIPIIYIYIYIYIIYIIYVCISLSIYLLYFNPKIQPFSVTVLIHLAICEAPAERSPKQRSDAVRFWHFCWFHHPI